MTAARCASRAARGRRAQVDRVGEFGQFAGRDDQSGFLGGEFGDVGTQPHDRRAMPGKSGRCGPGDAAGRNVADDVGEIGLDIPAQVPEDEGQRFRESGRTRQVRRREDVAVFRQQPEWCVRRKLDGHGSGFSFGGGAEHAAIADGKRHRERSSLDADRLSSVDPKPLPGPVLVFENVIQSPDEEFRRCCHHDVWRQTAQTGAPDPVMPFPRDQNLKPRCSATTPSAMLKYSTCSSPARSIIALSPSWSGCMRIDSER